MNDEMRRLEEITNELLNRSDSMCMMEDADFLLEQIEKLVELKDRVLENNFTFFTTTL